MLASVRRVSGLRIWIAVALTGAIAVLLASGFVRSDEHDHRLQAFSPVQPKQKCAEQPSLNTIRKALPKEDQGKPIVVEKVTKLVDQVDPPRVFPLIGTALLHHVHWKIQILVIEPSWFAAPLLFTPCVRPMNNVIYIDIDHLHTVDTQDRS